MDCCDAKIIICAIEMTKNKGQLLEQLQKYMVEIRKQGTEMKGVKKR